MKIVIDQASDPESLVAGVIEATATEVWLTGRAVEQWATAAAVCYAHPPAYGFFAHWKHLRGTKCTFIPNPMDPTYLGMMAGRVWYGIGEKN